MMRNRCSIADYELVKSGIGRGASGQVDLMKAPKTGVTVAVKLFHSSLSSTEAKKFLAEVDIMSSLRHPSLIGIFDYQIPDDNNPRKSIKLNSSCADAILIANNSWEVSNPQYIHEKYQPSGYTTKRIWIDVQLRWGDYDMHDIERYTRSLFHQYTQNPQSLYPCETGIMIGIDLYYNLWTVYGTFSPGLQEVMTAAMKNIMSFNSCLSMLRERVRKSLLYSAEPTEPALSSSNIGELFSNKITWIVDDRRTYRVAVQKLPCLEEEAEALNKS